MIGRSSRILLEVLAGIVGVVVLLGAAGAWRLSQGPVSLAFALPYVHEQLAQADGPLAIGIDDIILTWGGWERTLDIRVLGVSARNRDGAVVAAAPEISVSLRMIALARGEIVPTRLELIGPRLRVHRTEAGEFRVALGEATGPTGDTLAMLLDALLDPRNRESPLAELERISIVDGDLSVDDRKLGTTWRAPRLDIVLTRDNGGLSARFALDAALDRQTPHLSGTARYDARRGEIAVEGKIEGLRPDRLARQIAVLAPLAGVALAVDAEFEIHLTADGVLRDGRYRLSAGPGALRYPDLVPRSVPIRGASARGSFDVEASRIVLDRATFDLGGPTIGLSAVVGRAGGIVTVGGEVVVRKMSLADFKSYWPKTAAPGARGWVLRNVEDGEVVEARTSVQARSARSGDWTLDSVGASLRIEGATVHYLKPLIPIRQVGATITVSPTRVDVTIDGGDFNGLDVEEATIVISDDGRDDWTLSLDVLLRGELRSVLEILDHPSLGYVSELGIDVDRVTGRSAIRLRVGLPLLADLALDQVDIQAAANLAEVGMPGVIFGHDARDGTLTVQLDQRGMTLSGTVRLADVPATIVLYENFDDKAPLVRRYDVKATLDDAARRRLGVETAPYLAGPVAVDIVYIERADGESDVIAQLALDRATLSLSPFGWSKPPGTPGRARLDLAIVGGRVARVRGFDIQAADLVARGDIALGADGKTISRAEIRRFSLGARTDLSGVAVRRPDGGYDVSISGRALDGAALLEADAESDSGEAGPTLPPIRLDARLDRLWIDGDVAVHGVKIDAVHDGALWRRVTAAGRMSDTHRVEVRYRENPGDQSITLDSNDAGALLRAFDVVDNITGGALALKASKAGRGDAVPWRGHLALTGFRVVKAPILARLLTLASLTGISDLASGKGISFSRLDIPFAMQSKRLTISDARAVGSEIGIGSSGEIDLEAERIRLEGTVVPAYTLNTLVGRIPLLGDLFTGGKGGGVFAVTYSLSGPLADPRIRVNPLSVLAPGFLRNLLRGLGKAGTDPDVAPEPAPQD